MKSFVTALLALLVAVAVSACGGSNPPAAAPKPTDQPAITGTPAGFNSDDVAFAANTASSYAQTSQLTALVPEHSTNPDLIALAAAVDGVQAPDLETMKVFLVQWDSSSADDPHQAGPITGVPGAVDDATMGRLGSLNGKDFDVLWLGAMIGHQQGALALAQAEVAKGANVDAVSTAKRLVGTYQAQIGRMQQLLDRPQ